jgi:hypothetical protein
MSGGKKRQNVAQSLADRTKIRDRMHWEWQRGLLLVTLAFTAQMLPRSRDRESLFVEKLLDAQDAFDILAAIHALAGAALDGLELGKFRLPKTQNVSRKLAEFGHFANAKIQLLRDFDFRAFFGFCHRSDQEFPDL